MAPSSYNDLAQQFMALWQKQLGAVVNDREFIQSLLELMQTMQAPLGGKRESGTPAAKPAAAAHADDERLDQLDYRLQCLEKRLSQLEAGGARTTRARAARKRKR